MDKQSLTHQTHVIADKTGLPFNTVLTHFFLEVLFSRIAGCSAHNKVIFKGGFLISNILGIKTRTTVDIDLLVTGMDMSEMAVRTFINEVIHQPVNPEVTCELLSIQPIRDEDQYGGFRVRILCKLDNIRQIVPIDLATGDPITPRAIRYDYIPLFFSEPIRVTSYNIETILAEKVETIYRRGFINSRCKDFYDMHVIWRTKSELLDRKVLKTAFENTCAHRFTNVNRSTFNELVEGLRLDDQMTTRWRAYVKRNPFVGEIWFAETLDSLLEMLPFLI